MTQRTHIFVTEAEVSHLIKNAPAGMGPPLAFSPQGSYLNAVKAPWAEKLLADMRTPAVLTVLQ